MALPGWLLFQCGHLTRHPPGAGDGHGVGPRHTRPQLRRAHLPDEGLGEPHARPRVPVSEGEKRRKQLHTGQAPTAGPATAPNVPTYSTWPWRVQRPPAQCWLAPLPTTSTTDRATLVSTFDAAYKNVCQGRGPLSSTAGRPRRRPRSAGARTVAKTPPATHSEPQHSQSQYTSIIR